MFATARWRLVASFTAILALLLFGLSFGVYTIFQEGLYSDVDPALHQGATRYARLLAAEATPQLGLCPDFPRPFPPAQVAATDSFTVINCGGQAVWFNQYHIHGIYPPAISLALRGHVDLRTVARGRSHFRAASVPIREPGFTPGIIGAVQVWRQVNPQLHALNRLEQVLIGGGLGALLVAAIAGFFFSSRMLSPIRTAFDRQRKFIADASHELRTPLTLIRSSAEMVHTSSYRLDPDDSELLEDIINESDRMSRLVTDLLTLAQVDNSQIRLGHDPVDLAELVQRVHDDVSPLADQKGLSHTLDLSGPHIVIGDELRLRQLLLILLDNAIKYTRPGGSVQASVSGQNGQVSVRIEDSGVGIPAEALLHVFERFYRADGARTHESGGAGLGLSIADWIVRAHHGKIHLESRVGAGTRITVDLPSAHRRSEGESREE